MILRVCNKCKTEKDLLEFDKRKCDILGRAKICKACRKIYDKSKPRKIKSKEQSKKDRLKNKLRFLLKGARKRARKNNIEFNITKNDLILPDICPVLGIPITKENLGKFNDSSPSIDRIDNTKGYIKGNVCIISMRANKLKNNGTMEEHRKIVEYMLSHKNR